MIEKIKLNNGIEMPMEGFGVFQIPEEDCEQVVRNAIAEGYRLIDTASSIRMKKQSAEQSEAAASCGKTCLSLRKRIFSRWDMRIRRWHLKNH